MRSQLTDANISGIIDIGDWVADFAYSDAGNMTSKTTQSSQTDFTYVGNQMDTATDHATSNPIFDLGWDENGNMRNLPVSGVTTELAYNWDNKLRHGQYDNLTIDLRYDPSGNRIWKQSYDGVNTTTRKYIVDIVGNLPVILMAIDDSNDVVKKTYIYANAQIVAQHAGDDAGPIYFYLHDRLGSVRQIIDISGDVKNLYTYKPFGQSFATETTENVSNPFRFTGQYHDTEIDEYYLRARQYDPYISRFTSRDPVTGKFQEPLTLHAYLYCGNDPLNMIDPEGLWYKEVHRRFGDYGWGWEPERGFALFDYARLDIDKPPTDTRYLGLHFKSREEILPDLIAAAAAGNELEFAYLMHQWQDSYVHYDRLSGMPMGPAWHALAKLMGTEVDDPKDERNLRAYAWARCEIATLILEHFWFQSNPFSAGVEGWLDFLDKTPNPWLVSDLRYVEISTTTEGLIYEGPLTKF